LDEIHPLLARPDRTDKSKRNYFRYLEFQPNIVKNYNSEPHSTTKLVPDAAYAAGYDSIIDLRSVPPQSFTQGQYMRYLEPRELFDKKNTASIWSSTAHLIEKVTGVPGVKIASELRTAEP
jgi:hypothetical protein